MGLVVREGTPIFAPAFFSPAKGIAMFGWTLTFLFLTVVSAYLAFFGLGGMAATLVKIAFVVFLALLAGSGLIGLLRSEPPV